MNRLDMGDNAGTIVLMYGSEMVVIENNDLLSEISEYSDSSSSECGYEEMELQWFDKMPSKRYCCQEKQNPYVKLVRCDHLVKENRCPVDMTLDRQLLDGINHLDMKPKRKRRPAPILMSTDFISSEDIFPLNKVRKKVKKKLHRRDKIGSETSFVQQRELYDRKSIYNATAPLYHKCASPRVNIETDVTDDTCTSCMNIPVSEYNNSLVLSTEMMDHFPNHNNTALSQSNANCFIKSEPIDDYFEGTGLDTAHALVKTEVNIIECSDTVGLVKCEKSHENNIMDVENEWKSLEIKVKCGVIDEDESTSKFTLSDQVLTKRKQAFTEESDNSDVDVENDWDYPLFIGLERVRFEHNYCSEQKQETKGLPKCPVPSKFKIRQSNRTLTDNEQTTTKVKTAMLQGNSSTLSRFNNAIATNARNVSFLNYVI